MATKIFYKSTGSGSNKLPLLILLFAGSVLMLISSCVDKPKKRAINFFCLKYEKSSVEKWMGADKRLAGFVLQFYSTEGKRNDTAFGSISYPLDSSRAYLMPPDTLTIERDSTAKNFDGKIVVGNNWISKSAINKVFFKPDGTPRDFDYILLIPKLDKNNTRHIVYDLKVYKGTTEIPDVFLGGDESRPSPPAPPEV